MNVVRTTFFLVILCLGIADRARAEWSVVRSPTLSTLRAVYFLDDERGWIVGSRGNWLTTADGGKNWQLQKSFTQDTIVDVYFTDANNGWVLCERDVYSSGKNALSYLRRTTDGGKNWESVDLDSGRDRLVRFAFSKDGYGTALGEGGALWQMLDDRVNWKRTPLPVKFLMLGGWFVDSFNGVLVGGAGTTLFTTDAGVEWAFGTSDKTVQTRLNDVVFIDAKRGWAVGAQGTILSTVNGGRSWKVEPSIVSEELLAVCFASSGFGVAVGDQGHVLETSGTNPQWTRVNSGVQAKLHDVAATSDTVVAVGFGGTILLRRETEKGRR